MEIALRPEHERMLHELVADGSFSSTDEALAAALELLGGRRELTLEEERQLVQVGIEELDRGEYTTLKTPDDYRAFAAEIVRRSKAAKDDDLGNSPG